ncbi:MAG: hypothetical protein QOG53_552 [Frankiales bacterium]|nr:hypothetical protein [Frankiales bacterium]
MRRSHLRRAALVAALGLGTVIPLATMAAHGATKPVATFTPYVVTDGTDPVTGGEPSLGYDPKHDVVVFGAAIHQTTMKFTDTAKGTTLKQTDVTEPIKTTSLDPITFVDKQTGRIFASQLLLACSEMYYSDDAGDNWTQSSGCGLATLLDHQTVGGGPFHAPLTGGVAGYPNAVYYCAQNGFNASCSVSLDGGLTFGPGVPISNTPINDPGNPYGGACSGIHGHLKVAPNGTAYIPIKGCHGKPTFKNLTNSEFWGGQPAVSVSKNNGITWRIHTVPGGHNADESDTAVDIDKAGRVYLGWQDGTNPNQIILGNKSSAKTAYSDDEGKTWSKPYDLSSALGVKNVQFPQVVAGDKGRAAIAFIGTDAVGDDQHNGFLVKNGKPGVWHLYVSLTYDGGKTWKTIDTTPKDPVQRGCVDLQGLSNKTATDPNICDQRNMLDFNDITIDGKGRVIVGYSDGCIGACVKNNSATANESSHENLNMVMRQSSGRGLLAAFDPKTGTSGGTPGGSASGGNSGGQGSLATTGGTPLLALAGLFLLVAGVGLRRWWLRHN